MNKKTTVIALFVIALLCFSLVTFVTSYSEDENGNPRGVQIVDIPALTQAMEETATYPYAVRAGYDTTTTTPTSGPSSNPLITFTATPSEAHWPNLGPVSPISSNKSVQIKITNGLGSDIYITNITAEVTSDEYTDPFDGYSGFSIISVDVLDLGLDRPDELDEDLEPFCLYDEANYWLPSANPDTVVTINDLHRDNDTFYDSGGSETPAYEIPTGPGGLIFPETESFDAAATGHVGPIFLEDGKSLTEYFAVKLWGELSSPTIIDGTITITLTYIVVQTSQVQYHCTGAIGNGYTANPAAAPLDLDPADLIDFTFSPDRIQDDEIWNRGLAHGGSPVYGLIPNASVYGKNLIDMTITNNKAFDIILVDLIMNLTDCTETVRYDYGSSGRYFGNESNLHMSPLNAMDDGELARSRYVDQDELRQAFIWYDNECGNLSTGNDPEFPGPKVGPASMMEFPGSTPRSTMPPPQLFPAGSTLWEAFAGRWFDYQVNGTQVQGTVDFKLLYRIIETPPVVDVTAVTSSTEQTFERQNDCGPVQVNVTVVATAPITATVGALIQDAYNATWMEIGTSTVPLVAGPNVVSFDLNFDGSIVERSKARYNIDDLFSIGEYYGCWEGQALKGMVVANLAGGVTHFDELISGQLNVTCPGDADVDGKVGFKDLGKLSNGYGSRPGDGNWNPLADWDCDEKIGFKDLGLLSNKYGTKY
jgi:hypothetical protein